ncbi:hypothetical protein V6N11_039605 [Hibiscus sabdariffa]|uniref:Uncharacterized protein n=1 Tax=Hibiscus sabdariffa TaxID=183260 RepID=A0ABR2SNH7_9ROSI
MGNECCCCTRCWKGRYIDVGRLTHKAIVNRALSKGKNMSPHPIEMKNQDEFHCAMEDMLPTGTSRLETHISHRHKMILMSLRPMNNTAVNREILKYLHDQVK